MKPIPNWVKAGILAAVLILVVPILFKMLMMLLIAPVALQNFSEAQVRAKVSRVKNDMRSLHTAIETYKVDHQGYPSTVPLVQAASKAAAEIEKMGGARQTTVLAGGGPSQPGLTTPIAYLTSLFLDPFVAKAEVPFAYYTNGSGWILISPGPDQRYDLVPETDFSDQAPTPQMITKTFDPTNGTISGGDIWRASEFPIVPAGRR